MSQALCPICGQAYQDVSFTGIRSGKQVIGSVPDGTGGGCIYCSPPLQIAPNTVYLLDCITGMKRMKDESIDLIVSDPPYLISYRTNHRADKKHDFCSPIQNDSNPDLIREYIHQSYRILKQNRAFYMFCSSKTVDFFKQTALDAGFSLKNSIIWIKGNGTMGDLKAQFGQQYEVILLLNKGRAMIRGKRIGDVWDFPRVKSSEQIHQNQKPVSLISQCIEKHSDAGDTVFDGFMGSGTTAVAACQTGRQFIGFEIEPRYFWMVHNRLVEVQDENETG